jgi:hypothetical protein
MVQRNYVFLLLLSFGGLLCHFALCAENNDSRIMYLPRNEYIRVISGIINPPPESKEEGSRLENFDDGGDNGDDAADDTHRVHFLPDDAPAGGIPVRKRKVSQNKRDSFFFLQRSMERRSGRSTMNDNNDTA